MSVLDTVISFLTPYKCISCSAEGSLLCNACQNKLPGAKSVCFMCLQPTVAFETCEKCFKKSNVTRVWRVAAYGDIAKEMVWRLKFTGARSAATDMAMCMARIYRPNVRTIIVPIPTATSRVRQRGYDQADLLARAYAKLVKVRFTPALARSGQQHQRGASRLVRQQQLSQAYRVTKPNIIKGAHVLLVDDVATTGASLQAAAKVLIQAGASQVEAMVFAQA